MKVKYFIRDLLTSFLICIILNVILTKIGIPHTSLRSLVSIKLRSFWFGTVILFLLFNVFFFLKKSWYLILSTFLFVVITAIGYTNSIKMEKRADPIVPNDLYLLKESWAMSKEYVSKSQMLLLVAGLFAFIVTAFIILRKKRKPSAAIGYRLIVSVLCVASLFILSSIKSDKFWHTFGISNKMAMPAQNLSDNGFVMGNFIQLTTMSQQKPDGYSKKDTEAIIQRVEKNSLVNQVSGPSAPTPKPNVIVILLEAFFDPTTLPNVTFSQDPIPFFHSLKKNYTNGKMSVNIFGAGTANSEFEVLTSMSLKLFPYETTPYTSYVIQPVDSVAYRLKKIGYNTSGLHNNVGWFYNRSTAWPYLGIDYKMFSDEMFKDKNTKTVYDVPAVPKDTELFKYIYQQTSATNGRDFVQGVSMELHGPYTLWYGHDIKVSSDVLPQKSKDILEEYAYKINEVDNALQQLINYYQNSDEPTMIVMYGDHQPWLGDNNLIYRQLGVDDQSNSIKNHNRLYETPFLIWDNYRNKPKEEINLGSSFLMPYVFKELGIKGNGLQTFLQEKMNEGIYRLPPAEFQKQEGWTPEDLKEYRYLQYYYLTEPSAVKQ